MFNLPYVKERYEKTLEVCRQFEPKFRNLPHFQACALISDLKILEDGDESEIGERGVSSPSLTAIRAFD